MRFEFRLIPFLVTLVLFASGIGLAQWQTRRATYKEQLYAQQEKFAAMPAEDFTPARKITADIEFRHFRLRGQFLPEWAVYLDNRPLHGVAGFIVLMPFKLDGQSDYVLVARGWQARDPQDRSHLPAIPTPRGELVIEGIARSKLEQVMQLGKPDKLRPGVILQNLNLADFAAASQLPLQDFIVEQTTAMPDGLQREWRLPENGADRHRGYVFQWYALAVMSLLFFVVTGFRSGKKTDRP
jgi:surfeit locus 1 family protein